MTSDQLFTLLLAVVCIGGPLLWNWLSDRRDEHEQQRRRNDPFYALHVRKYEALAKMRAVVRESRNRSTRHHNTRR